MREEPKNPPPVYAPEPVAEAILYAAENPVRDIYVGVARRALTVGAFVAPRLTDKVMEFQMFDAQKEDFPSASHHNGLDHASGSLLERGSYSGHVAESSLYTKGSLHPFIAACLSNGPGLGVRRRARAKKRFALNEERLRIKRTTGIAIASPADTSCVESCLPAPQRSQCDSQL